MYAYCYLGSEHIVFRWFEQRRDCIEWIDAELEIVRTVLNEEPSFGVSTNKEFNDIIAPILKKLEPNIEYNNRYISIRKIHPKIKQSFDNMTKGCFLIAH